MSNYRVAVKRFDYKTHKYAELQFDFCDAFDEVMDTINRYLEMYPDIYRPRIEVIRLDVKNK